jgi:hypothetical protein
MSVPPSRISTRNTTAGLRSLRPAGAKAADHIFPVWSNPSKTHLSHLLWPLPDPSPPPFGSALNPDKARATKTGQITNQPHAAARMIKRAAWLTQISRSER